MACAAFTACKRATKMKNMSSIERNLFSEKVTDVHPVIPVLTHQFVEELCGLIVESFISVILRDGSTNTINILFVVFPWTGHLSHLDPFSCPLVPHLWKQRQDHPLIVTGVWLIHPTLIHLPESFIIPPNTSQPPTAADSTCADMMHSSRQCIKKFRWIISCSL